MIQLTIRFDEHDVEFDVGPAFVDLNVYYRAAAMAFVQPHSLAATLNRVPEEKARSLMAHTIVEGCIFDSRPEMTSDQRYDWLIAHPFEADQLRSLVEHRANFVGGEQNGDAEAAPKTDEPAGGSDRTGGRRVDAGRVQLDRSDGDSPDAG